MRKSKADKILKKLIPYRRNSFQWVMAPRSLEQNLKEVVICG